MEKCCREVLREVLERSVIEKCWSSQHRQEMPTNAQLFEYDLLSPHLHIYCRVILPCLQPSTISNTEKKLQKNRHRRTVVSL